MVKSEEVGDEHTSRGKIFLKDIEILLFKYVAAQANVQIK